MLSALSCLDLLFFFFFFDTYNSSFARKDINKCDNADWQSCNFFQSRWLMEQVLSESSNKVKLIIFYTLPLIAPVKIRLYKTYK